MPLLGVEGLQATRHDSVEQLYLPGVVSGLGRFVFAERVKGFWTAGPVSIPVKREIYPTWLERSE